MDAPSDPISTPADHARTEQAADRLWRAWVTGDRIATLPEVIRPRDLVQGWAIQQAIAERAGSSYGWKLAATAPAGQAHIGVDAPLPGLLFERFLHVPGDVLPSADLHMSVAEAEFVFRMGSTVAAGASRTELVDAVAAVHLAVEVPDSRFADFGSVGAAQLLADTACASRFVLGPELADWQSVELATTATSLWINEVEVEQGSGGNVLGDPWAALAWLVEALPGYGSELSAGSVVTTGTTTVPATISAGDSVRATFGTGGEHGSVGFRFA